jgi:SEC-C motif
MPKLGRNDHCHCGSGKKYKHCHWNADQAASAARLNTRRARQSLFGRLVDFAQRPRFEPDLRSAFDLFWDGRRKSTEKNALDQFETTRFYEWYLIDYRSSHDRQRLIDMFRAQGAGYITPEERAYLGAWQSSRFGVFEVRELLAGGAVHLDDLLRDEGFDMLDESYTSAMLPGEIYMARTARREALTEFIFSVSLVPVEEKDRLLAFAHEKFAAYADAHFGAKMADFLRDSNYLFNHYLLNMRGETAKTDAKVVLPTRAEFMKTAATLNVAAPQA